MTTVALMTDKAKAYLSYKTICLIDPLPNGAEPHKTHGYGAGPETRVNMS